MKRNETILVYAVTGLLLAILLVAVVFGESTTTSAKTLDGKDSTRLATLPGVAPVNPPREGGDGVEEDDGKGGVPADPVSPDPEVAKKPDPVPDPKAGEGTLPGTVPAPESKPGGRATDLNATVSAEHRLETALGGSRRMGEYRVVKSRQGDTLTGLVERWCVDASLLPDVEVVNEHLRQGSLSAGREVLVPWVEADKILAAVEVRAAEAAKAEYAKGEVYALVKGDSLWKIAKSRVGEARLVPAWIERFKELNPEITDPSVLVVGQKVRLPR